MYDYGPNYLYDRYYYVSVYKVIFYAGLAFFLYLFYLYLTDPYYYGDDYYRRGRYRHPRYRPRPWFFERRYWYPDEDFANERRYDDGMGVSQSGVSYGSRRHPPREYGLFSALYRTIFGDYDYDDDLYSRHRGRPPY